MIQEKQIVNYRISVVTPTFNRESKIHRVFDSLKAQTYHNFEWIVIDDGSTDKTEDLIESYRDQKPFFPIVYFKKVNEGVVRALGASLPFIQGDFVIRCDSDDAYTPNMLEELIKTWDSIPEEDKSHFRAVSAPVMDQGGHFFGKPLGVPYLDTTYLDLEHKWKRRTDRLWLERADLWKKFNFGLGIADHLIWYPDIVRNYKIRCIDTPLKIYYRGEEGAVTTQKSKQAAYLRLTASLGNLNWEMDYFLYDPIAITWRASNIWLYGYALGYSLGRTASLVDNFWGKCLLYLTLPLGLGRIREAKRAGIRWQ